MKRRSFKITLYSNVYSQLDPPEKATTRSYFSPCASCEFGIYRYVFTSKMAILAASLLCISLLLQPVASAYAQESEGAESQPVAGSAANINTDAAPEEILNDEVVEASTEAEQAIMETVSAAPEVSEAATEVQEALDSDESLVATTTQTTDIGSASITTNTDTTTSTATSTSTTVVDDTENDSEDEAAGNDEIEIDTTTETTTGETIIVSNVQTDNTLAFGKNECTEVADGSYYCQKLSLTDLPQDALFAAPDSTGDMEIFVVQAGIERKVTDNTVDDASPYYDARSETLVWHRLVQDRYQIISYDIDSGEETVLTDTNVNNMEPTRNGAYTVWQRWVKNNWEIILFDGTKEQQLTDSAQHDIAPHIHGDLIIWNVRASDGTESLMTYDIISKNYKQIADPDGVSVTNPRMLVMYEAQYQNGDTIMKGFDLVTGEIVPIERLPRELPDEIPSPETTGEVRALPTNPQTEQEIVIQEDPDADPDDNTSVHDLDDADLNLAAAATTTIDTVATTTLDLDLRPLATVAATTTSDRIVEQATIPDVIIPEFDAATADRTATSTQES